jgi:hypothetical protein
MGKTGNMFERMFEKLFYGPSSFGSGKVERGMKENRDQDRIDNPEVPRTAKEERERQKRLEKRVEIAGGGDGLRHNDMKKGGWGGTMSGGGLT